VLHNKVSISTKILPVKGDENKEILYIQCIYRNLRAIVTLVKMLANFDYNSVHINVCILMVTYSYF